MADVSAIRTGAQATIDNIAGLRVYDTWPDQIHTPAAIVKPVRWDYRLAMGNVNRALFEIVLLAAPLQIGLARAQDILDAYLDDTGASSVKETLESDKTLNSTVTTLQVPGWRDYGSIEVNGVDYVGVIFDLEVWP